MEPFLTVAISDRTDQRSGDGAVILRIGWRGPRRHVHASREQHPQVRGEPKTAARRYGMGRWGATR